MSTSTNIFILLLLWPNTLPYQLFLGILSLVSPCYYPYIRPIAPISTHKYPLYQNQYQNISTCLDSTTLPSSLIHPPLYSLYLILLILLTRTPTNSTPTLLPIMSSNILPILTITTHTTPIEPILPTLTTPTIYTSSTYTIYTLETFSPTLSTLIATLFISINTSISSLSIILPYLNRILYPLLLVPSYVSSCIPIASNITVPQPKVYTSTTINLYIPTYLSYPTHSYQYISQPTSTHSTSINPNHQQSLHNQQPPTNPQQPLPNHNIITNHNLLPNHCILGSLPNHSVNINQLSTVLPTLTIVNHPTITILPILPILPKLLLHFNIHLFRTYLPTKSTPIATLANHEVSQYQSFIIPLPLTLWCQLLCLYYIVTSLNTFIVYLNSIVLCFSGLLFLLVYCIYWIRDGIREYTSTYMSVITMISISLLGILVSESILFATLFWSLFQPFCSYLYSLEGVYTSDPSSHTYSNTIILMASGVSLGSVLVIRDVYRLHLLLFLYVWIIALTFQHIQIKEFYNITLYMNESVYVSMFFSLLGLHLFHILIGILLIGLILWTSCYSRSVLTFTLPVWFVVTSHQLSSTLQLVYWHFVDLLWLIIYYVLYN